MDEQRARARAAALAGENGLGAEYALAVLEKRILLVRDGTLVRDVVAWVARFRTPRLRAELAFDDASGELLRWDAPKAGR